MWQEGSWSIDCDWFCLQRTQDELQRTGCKTDPAVNGLDKLIAHAKRMLRSADLWRAEEELLEDHSYQWLTENGSVVDEIISTVLEEAELPDLLSSHCDRGAGRITEPLVEPRCSDSSGREASIYKESTVSKLEGLNELSDLECLEDASLIGITGFPLNGRSRPTMQGPNKYAGNLVCEVRNLDRVCRTVKEW